MLTQGSYIYIFCNSFQKVAQAFSWISNNNLNEPKYEKINNLKKFIVSFCTSKSKCQVKVFTMYCIIKYLFSETYIFWISNVLTYLQIFIMLLYLFVFLTHIKTIFYFFKTMQYHYLQPHHTNQHFNERRNMDNSRLSTRTT